MIPKPQKSYREFYAMYLLEHKNPTNQALHFFGNGLTFFLLLFALYDGPWWLFIFAPCVRLAFTGIGHFVFEKNRPRSRWQPVYNVIADFHLFWDILTFQLPEKMRNQRYSSRKDQS